MLNESENSCPHCFEPVEADHEFCNNCGGHLKQQEIELEVAKQSITSEPTFKETSATEDSVLDYEMKKAELIKHKYGKNTPATISIILTVIAAILYAIPMPAISLYGGVPFSFFAIIAAIVGLTKPYQRTRKIVAIVIAVVAPIVWVTQFFFFGIYWL